MWLQTGRAVSLKSQILLRGTHVPPQASSPAGRLTDVIMWRWWRGLHTVRARSCRSSQEVSLLDWSLCSVTVGICVPQKQLCKDRGLWCGSEEESRVTKAAEPESVWSPMWAGQGTCDLVWEPLSCTLPRNPGCGSSSPGTMVNGGEGRRELPFQGLPPLVQDTWSVLEAELGTRPWDWSIPVPDGLDPAGSDRQGQLLFSRKRGNRAWAGPLEGLPLVQSRPAGSSTLCTVTWGTCSQFQRPGPPSALLSQNCQARRQACAF